MLVADQRLESLRDKVVRATPIHDWRHVEWFKAGNEKYGENFWIAEQIKTEMRRDYALKCKARSYEVMVAESMEFWEEYEEVNRLWLPSDPVYTGTRSGVTLATTTDLWTYTSPASGQARILESYIGGESTSSTVLRLAVQRSTGGATATNQTPEKINTRSPAAVGTFATTWTTQPTLSGNPQLYHAFNTFGGTDRWIAQPGVEIYQVNGELMSARSASGTPAVSSHVFFEEL